MGAISPQEVKALFEPIPSEVFEAINSMIISNWNAGEALVVQDDLVALILEKFKANGKQYEYQDVFRYEWLKIEPFYEDKGWIVGYLECSDQTTLKFVTIE